MRGAFAMGLQEVKDCVQNQIRSFIILDLETTSLPDDRPVKITEIAMVAAMREHILGYGDATSEVTTLPRALSKLTICVHPRRVISGPASDITHLTNDLLEHQRPFDEYLFSMLDGFMKRMPQPVCIIAHNGIKFDFPVLQAELFNIGKAFPDHIMCADSLPGFRKLLQAYSGVSLNGSSLPQDKRSTNQGCQESVDSAVELGVYELHLSDYDEALCSVLEAVEADPLSQSNYTKNVISDDKAALPWSATDTVKTVTAKDEYKVIISSSPEVVKKKTGVTVSRKALEKTPDRPSNVEGKYPYSAAGDSCATPPGVETLGSIKGKRNGLNISLQARKRLNFSSNPESQNKPKSFKLDDVYRFLLKRDPVNSHCAENDALNLLECIVALGHTFVEWLDKNAIQFNSVKKMD